MLVFTRQEINTIRRALELNIKRLEKIIDEVEDLAAKNKREMENKLNKLEALDTKLIELTYDE